MNVEWKIRDGVDRTSAEVEATNDGVMKDNLLWKLFINIVGRIKKGDLSLIPKAHREVEEYNGLQLIYSLSSVYHNICTVAAPHTHTHNNNNLMKYLQK